MRKKKKHKIFTAIFDPLLAICEITLGCLLFVGVMLVEKILECLRSVGVGLVCLGLMWAGMNALNLIGLWTPLCWLIARIGDIIYWFLWIGAWVNMVAFWLLIRIIPLVIGIVLIVVVIELILKLLKLPPLFKPTEVTISQWPPSIRPLNLANDRPPGITNLTCAHIVPTQFLFRTFVVRPDATTCEGCRDYRLSTESSHVSNNFSNSTVSSSVYLDDSSGLGHYWSQEEQWEIGDLTCEYNAHSALLRCTVHPSAETCAGCRDYRSV